MDAAESITGGAVLESCRQSTKECQRHSKTTGQPCKTTEMGSRTGEPWEAESPDRTSATTAEVGWSDAGKKEMRKCIPLTIEEKRKQIAKQLRDIKDLRNDCDMITADAKWFKANLEKMHDECYDPRPAL